MGTTMADFGAVPTAGLVDRAKQKAAVSKEWISAQPVPGPMKRALLASIDNRMKEIDELWAKAQTGDANAEVDLRARLVKILNPDLLGGNQGIRLRW